jgi:hypothetical protein
MATMQERVRELEARRAKGESVPELDAMYRRIDDQTNKAHAETTKSLSGEMPDVKPLPGKGKPEKTGDSAKPLPGKGKTEKLGEGAKKYASGGSVKSASSRADGIAQRGKTRGRIC